MITREPISFAAPRNAFQRIGQACLRSLAEIGRATTIALGAFDSCPKLTTIHFGSGLEEIASNAFTNSPITELMIPDSVVKLNPGAIYSANKQDLLRDSLRKVHWPAGVRIIPDNQFLGFPALEEIEIPEGVTGIGGNVFQDCLRLTQLQLPESLTTIGPRAFYRCTGLTTLTVPAGVRSLNATAFDGCDNLRVVYAGG